MKLFRGKPILGSFFFISAMLLAGPASAEIDGSWTFDVTISGAGSGSAQVELETDGQGGLSGHYTGQLGDTDISGSVEGDSFRFEVPGQMGTVVYTGEEQDDGTLEGSVALGNQASGEFVATRRDG